QHAGINGLRRIIAIRKALGCLAGRRIYDRLLLHDTQPLAVPDEEVLTIAVSDQPAFELLGRGSHLGLTDRQFLEIGIKVDEEKDDQRQAKHGESHGAEAPQNESEHFCPLPVGLGSATVNPFLLRLGTGLNGLRDQACWSPLHLEAIAVREEAVRHPLPSGCSPYACSSSQTLCRSISNIGCILRPFTAGT